MICGNNTGTPCPPPCIEEVHLVERNNETLATVAKEHEGYLLPPTTVERLKLLNRQLSTYRPNQPLAKDTLVVLPPHKGFDASDFCTVDTSGPIKNILHRGYLPPEIRDYQQNLYEVLKEDSLFKKYPHLEIFIEADNKADQTISFKKVGNMAVQLERKITGKYWIQFGGYFSQGDKLITYRFNEEDIQGFKRLMSKASAKQNLSAHILEVQKTPPNKLDEQVHILFTIVPLV